VAGLEANNRARADTASTFIGSLLYRYIYFWGMYVAASNSHKLKPEFNFLKSELPGRAAARPACHPAAASLPCPPSLALEGLPASESTQVPAKRKGSAPPKNPFNAFQYSHRACGPFECQPWSCEEPEKHAANSRV